MPRARWGQAALVRTGSKAARQCPSPRCHVWSRVAISLLGVEPGSVLLCWRTGCVHLSNAGAYPPQRAAKICECRERNGISYKENFLVLNATRVSEELMADVVVKMFCIFRQPLIKTLCM